MADRQRLLDVSVGRWVPFPNVQVDGAAYGGLVGNAAGFARYLQSLLSENGILSPENRARLFTVAAGPGPARSLGWVQGELNGELWFAHAGGAMGYYCELRIYPHAGRGSVILFNRTGIRDERILDRIDRHLIR